MERKKALALASLLILTATLTTSFYVQQPATADPGEYHWKISLTVQYANAKITGWLTDEAGYPIKCTNFTLVANYSQPPQSLFVFAKVKTNQTPYDIDFVKWIDWDLDGTYETGPIPVHGFLVQPPTPSEPWYHDQEHGPDYNPTPDPDTGRMTYGQMVVVEVREQPYDTERPYFEWQLTLTQKVDITARWTGVLTDKNGQIIPGTEFDIICDGTQQQCVVIKTPWSRIPYDIYFMLNISGVVLYYDGPITQFPRFWKWYGGPDFEYWTPPSPMPPPLVELEITEVQSYNYVVMGGTIDSAGQLAAFPRWILGQQPVTGVPFATRAPYFTPMLTGQNITFTQKNPITGLVKLSVPPETYIGLDHWYYSPRVGTYFRVQIYLEEQGCGYLFTGDGKDPILGDVDIITFNNNTGVYTFGPDGSHSETPDLTWLDDELMALDGWGPPLGPCLQELSGSDGIPGTADDPFGDGILDPPGSSILYLPTTMNVTYLSSQGPNGVWDGPPPAGDDTVATLFVSPWPQLLTTASAYDIVIEPDSLINGQNSTEVGEPWEFVAGIDHPGQQVPWKQDKSNAYVTYVCSWSVLEHPTAMGLLDVMFEIKEKKVREDLVIADIDCNELVDIVDVVIAALAFGGRDEGIYGSPVPSLHHSASANYDARGDVRDVRGEIDIVDIVRIAIDFGKSISAP